MSGTNPSEEERLVATAKALGDVCVYPWNEQGFPGITLRQWYAGLAMQGLLAGDDSGVFNDEGAARAAVHFADALLKELAK